MTTILVILAILAVAFIFAVKGRKNYDGIDELKGWYYAHRGLHGDGIPENSMAAFRAARDAGYGIELDVHLMADGKLAVIHDSSLERTAGANVFIEDLTAEDLADFQLEGTDEKIPLLSQVLNLYHGAAPIIVELKSFRGNASKLCDAACALLKEYEGTYCMESFDPRCIVWLRTYHPDVIRGQLTQNFFRTNSRISFFLKFILKNQLMNFLTKPDFIAYRFEHRHAISNVICRKIWGMVGVTWTICSQEDLDTAVRENWIPIFENFKP